MVRQELLQNVTYILWGMKHKVRPPFGKVYVYAQHMKRRLGNKIKLFVNPEGVTKGYFQKIFAASVGNKTFSTMTKIWYSTGFYTVVAALNTCEKVVLYGVMNESHCKNPKYSHTKVCFVAEYQLTDSLIIKIHLRCLPLQNFQENCLTS